ncbi:MULTISPECIES: serine/threonine-protein kinase [Streptomyces]|uniref:serine/threonine-protein kinase n=1 Tax=Streptomyces TaxID=1883 RepID=UPI001E4CD692|nr:MULTISPECIES: serine/threonine-protein kinase [Streptomyces]UFQ17781.1 serine/threonine protein kinase [Streptomyces huasconensis]WCL87387.1 serine/threonine-protein kinase [Streptomyces sp. JCM 35825]
MTGLRDHRRFVGPGGRFELVDHIGSGGFGDVWRARDGMLGREVALKFLALDRLAGPRPTPERVPQIRDRFARESLIAAKVDSPYVARIYDCDMGDETPFLVMEYVDGEPLNAHVGITPLPLARTCRWSSQIAQGLAAAHDQSVVHRDIKPGNVLVREADSDVRIVDFGLSRFVDATETRSAAGTPLYMSPERCRAEPGDERSDLYSLGCVMYEMVTGWPPFGDTRADPVALAQAHQNKAPTPPRAQVEGVPPTLEKLIMTLLAKDPQHRPRNARAVVHAIKEVERDLDASGAERRADGPAPGPGASVSDSGFADQLSAAELTVRRLIRKHGQDHALVITARMELADLTGHSGDVRGAAALYDRLGRDCSAWFGPGHSRTLDAFEGMARWVSA